MTIIIHLLMGEGGGRDEGDCDRGWVETKQKHTASPVAWSNNSEEASTPLHLIQQ